jgi:hypothetical protein
MTLTFHHGDNRVVLRQLIDQGVRVQSVVCDPPYGLTSITKRFGSEGAAPALPGTDGAFQRASGGFMGQKWDASGIERNPEFWRLIYDILLPGGYCLAFSSPRTGHWMAVAMEQAGFIMHPFLGWCYGSGFPKAHDAAKAIDRELGAERERIPVERTPGWQRNIGNTRPYMSNPEHTTVSDDPATAAAAAWDGWKYGAQSMKPALEPIYVAQRPFDQKNGALNILTHGVGALNIGACRVNADVSRPSAPTSPDASRNNLVDSTSGTYPSHEACRECHSDDRGILASFEHEPDDHSDPLANASAHALEGQQSRGSPDDCPTCHGSDDGPARDVQVGAQASAQQQSDVDSAHARDGGREHNHESRSKASAEYGVQGAVVQGEPIGRQNEPSANRRYTECGSTNFAATPGPRGGSPLGRHPANLLHDGSDIVRQMFPSAPGQLASSSSSSETRKNQNCYGDMRRGSPDAVMEPRRESDTSAARFFNSFPLDTDPLFYCAKASKADRAGSRHPTVKPITLMRWLCRLVTPPGGTVLDPFAGSGTTGAAALAEGLNCLLIEAYDDYAADIRRRFAIPAPVNDDIDALIGGGIESLIG